VEKWRSGAGNSISLRRIWSPSNKLNIFPAAIE